MGFPRNFFTQTKKLGGARQAHRTGAEILKRMPHVPSLAIIIFMVTQMLEGTASPQPPMTGAEEARLKKEEGARSRRFRICSGS